MNLPSASSLERAALCPPSQVLLHFGSGGNRWAIRGTGIHAFLVRVAEVGAEKALAEVAPDLREACACIELDELPPATPDSYAYEVSLAWDMETDTARELCRNKSREDAYSLANSKELVGTCDVLGLTDDAVIVYDYKTGYRWFDRIEENFQLMFYALAAARAYGKERAHLAIIRIDEDGHPYFLRGEVGLFDLDAFAQRLRDLDATIADLKVRHQAGEALAPTTGDHCQYCPAVANCPAWMNLARSMTSPENDVPGLPALTADTAALYIEAVKRGKKVLERIERGLKLFAEQNPIELGGGWVYGPHPFPNDEWDVEKAWPVLQQFLGSEASKAINAKVVKKEIEGVYRERKKRGEKVLIKDTELVLEALEDAGALTKRFTFPIGEHKPKPELMEAANGEGHDAAQVG